MVSRVILVVVAVSLAAVGLSNPVPSSGPYLATPCDGAGQPACNVQFSITPQPVPGLSNALFQAWFASFGIRGASTGTYTWSVRDVNSSGVAIGFVQDAPLLIDTSFVFDQGKLICCSFDGLVIQDINDNGFLIGSFPIYIFNNYVGYCCGGLNSGQQRIPTTFLPPIYNIFSFQYFRGIDDSNRILAQTGNQEYELDPTPEPRSMVLFATALGLTLFLMRRRLCRPGC